MALKEGDMVQINYTGRNERGEVFETTQEQVTVKEGSLDSKRKYEPLTTIMGDKDLLQALESHVKEMKEGEQKKFSLEAKEAFGERKAEYVKMVSLQEFRQRNIQPFPGLVVDLNGVQGKVQTVSGGRVRVDFNHPLAGQKVEFELKLEKVISGS